MTAPPREPQPDGRPDVKRMVSGRVVVLAIVGLAVVLGLIGLKFRRPSPMQRERSQPPATAPLSPSMPATQQSPPSDLRTSIDSGGAAFASMLSSP